MDNVELEAVKPIKVKTGGNCGSEAARQEEE